jgi:hypothetical protein
MQTPAFRPVTMTTPTAVTRRDTHEGEESGTIKSTTNDDSDFLYRMPEMVKMSMPERKR